VALVGGQLEADGGALGGRGAVELGEHAAAVVLLAVEVEDRVVAEVLDQLDRGGQRGGAGGDEPDVLGRTPTVTASPGWMAPAATAAVTVPPPVSSMTRPASVTSATLPAMKFMRGEPRKPAANRVRGRR
jgi:hypothetical protein